jgi:hypothetical protein
VSQRRCIYEETTFQSFQLNCQTANIYLVDYIRYITVCQLFFLSFDQKHTVQPT